MTRPTPLPLRSARNTGRALVHYGEGNGGRTAEHDAILVHELRGPQF